MIPYLAKAAIQWYLKGDKGTKKKIMNRKITLAMLLASLAAVPVVFTTGCAVTQGRESAGRYVDDKTITAKVKTDLYKDPTVKGTQVNVTTFQGTVQLSGVVENQAQKDRAGEIAQQVKGVQSVRNDLVVQTGR